MSTKTLSIEPNHTLEEFQTTVQQQEGIWGPLLEMGNKDGENRLVMDITDSPQNRVVLEEYASDEPPEKSGYSTICNGSCYISGKIKKLAAYRLQ